MPEERRPVPLSLSGARLGSDATPIVAEATVSRSMLDRAPVAMMVVDRLDRCRYLNHRAAAWFGSGEVRNSAWYQWIDLQDRARVAALWKKAAERRQPFEATCLWDLPGARPVDVRLEASPDRDTDHYLFTIQRWQTRSSLPDPKREPRRPGPDERQLRMSAFSVDCCSTSIFWLRPDSSFIYVNEAAARMLGYTREELLSMSVHDLDPNYGPDIWPEYWQRIKTQRSMTFESTMRCKNRQLLPVDITTNYLDYEGDEFVFAFVNDITARKQMEDELRSNADRLDLAMSITNHGIYDWDLPANQLFFDHRFYTMAGYEPDEFPANYSEWAKRVHPDDLPEASVAVNDFIGGRISSYDQEFRFLRKSGDWMWVRARVRVVNRDARGKPLRVVGTYTDVTEARRAQDRLRSREQYTRRLLDGLPQLIWVAPGPDKHCTQFNKQWLDYTGRTLTEELGDGWIQSVHPDDRAACLQVHADAFMQRERYDTEYRLKGADGNYRWFLDSGLPWYEADGKFAGFIGASVDITDRKEAEKALRSSEAKYADLYENSPDMMCSIDAAEGTILQCNDAMAQTLGYSKRELLGKNVMALLAQESVQRVREKILPRFQKLGALQAEELRFITADGSHCDVILNSTAVRDERGKIVRTRSVMKDVTERLRTQRALRRSEEMFRGLVQTAPFGVQRSNFEGRILFASDTLAEIYGTTPENLVGRSVLEFAVDDKAREAMRRFLEWQRTNLDSPRTFEARNRTFDGRTIDVSIDWTYDRDAAGQPIGFIVVVSDITERKEAERALEFQADVLNRVSDAVLVTCRNGDASYANEAAKRLCGVGLLSPKRSRFWKLERPEFLVADRDESIRQQLRAHGVWEGERELTIDDQKRVFEIKLKLFPSPSGSEQLLLSVIRDTSARHQAELENRQHREVLAHVARLSTMGELVAGIAHEVKQPLYAISNFCTATSVELRQLHADEPIDRERIEGLRECNEGVRHAAVRASEIIRRLREFSRRSERQYEEVDLNGVVHDAVNLLAFKARECLVEIRTQLQDDLPPIVADRIQCEQVLVNLLNNAFEAMSETSGQRFVLIRTMEKEDHVELQVSDNGPGIAEHEHARLFEAFYTTKNYGMGMGLAISRTIVEDHGGRLAATTNRDSGATFTVSLPRARIGEPSWKAS